MTGNSYQKLAMRTNDGESSYRLAKAFTHGTDDSSNIYDFGGMLMACLGLAGEVGEFNDMIKKSIFHRTDFDEEHAKKELGDIMWYVAMMCTSFGWQLDEIMEMNIDKLKKRYPEGFNVYDANHRKEQDV